MSENSKRPSSMRTVHESNLTDLIFGLALSVGAISLVLRLPNRPFGILFDIGQFGFSFLILISVWLSYTNIMSVLPLEDNFTVALNLVMLFLVSIEPYLFYLNIIFDAVANERLLNTASIVYAVDLAGLMAIQALFTQQLAQEERKLLPHDMIRKYKRIRDTLFMSAAIFAVTALPFFWVWRIGNTPLRFYMWFVPLVVSSLRHVSKKRGAGL